MILKCVYKFKRAGPNSYRRVKQIKTYVIPFVMTDSQPPTLGSMVITTLKLWIEVEKFTWLATVHCRSMGSWMKSSNLVPISTGMAFCSNKKRREREKNIRGNELLKRRRESNVSTWFHFLAWWYQLMTLQLHRRNQNPERKRENNIENFSWENLYLFKVHLLVRSNMYRIATESLQAIGMWLWAFSSPKQINELVISINEQNPHYTF